MPKHTPFSSMTNEFLIGSPSAQSTFLRPETPKTQGPVPILILKTESTPDDKYRQAFEQLNFKPTTFLTPLHHEPVPEGATKLATYFHAGAFAEGPAQVYGGLIITSARAVEIARETLRVNDAAFQKLWDRNLLVYVVGGATELAVHSQLGTDETCILGAETGNGDALAAFIQKDYNARHQSQPESSPLLPPQVKKPLLFLTGETHRRVIPETLGALPDDERIRVEELIVYRTAPDPAFPSRLESELRAWNPDQSPLWLAIFSPSNIRGVLEAIWLFTKGSRKPSVESSAVVGGEEEILDEQLIGLIVPDRLRIAAIGPTTLEGLGRWGVICHAVAKTPNPQGLVDAITVFEG